MKKNNKIKKSKLLNFTFVPLFLFSLLLLISLFTACKKKDSSSSTTPSTKNSSNCKSSTIKNFDFNLDDTSFWSHSDGWANGGQFLVGWKSDHLKFNSNIMTIKLDTLTCPSGCSTKNYASGEYRSLNFFKYGKYQMKLKASSESGTVTSLFTYTGSSDGNPHDEIDIEILGGDITNIHFNYWTNGTQHPKTFALGFDASVSFHTYSFIWLADSIKWYVDNKLIYTQLASGSTLPTHSGKIMLNYWAATGWAAAGTFSYSVPTSSQYDFFKFTPESCL